jgi:hypothetical protein
VRPESQPGAGTGVPFTAVVCHGQACRQQHGESVVNGLRECVRRGRNGVLLSTGCLLGRLGCHTLSSSNRPQGALLVIQPCTESRAPAGPALWIGPLADADDIVTVSRWLAKGELHPIGLPSHLRFPARRGTTN